MKSEELFRLIDKIDEELIEDAWTGCMTQPEQVTSENSPFEAFRVFTAIAASVVLLGSAFYLILRMRMGNVITPNNSGISSVSSSEVVSDSSEDVDVSEGQSDISDTDAVYSAKDDCETYSFTYEVSWENPVFCGPTTKSDNLDYAVIDVWETNATEDDPITAVIYAYRGNTAKDEMLSRSVSITGAGRYVIPYTKLRGAGSLNELYLHTKSDSILSVSGEWIP